MEKVIVALWAPTGEDRAAFGARLLATLPQALAAAGVDTAMGPIRVNVRDATVAAGDGLVQQWQEPQQDAVVQFWLPSANARFRGAVDAALGRTGGRFHAWLACESTIIPNRAQPPAGAGTPTPGWSQASFISFRTDMTRTAAIAHWHGHHTRVAIETQANFEYVQNLIVRPLTDGAPAYDAFVEECFPAAALSAPEVFFDAADDPARFAANLAAMTDSCARFIDFARIDIIPTRQYDFAPPV